MVYDQETIEKYAELVCVESTELNKYVLQGWKPIESIPSGGGYRPYFLLGKTKGEVDNSQRERIAELEKKNEQVTKELVAFRHDAERYRQSLETAQTCSAGYVKRLNDLLGVKNKLENDLARITSAIGTKAVKDILEEAEKK